MNRGRVLAVLTAAVLTVAGCASSSGKPKATGSDLVGQNQVSAVPGRRARPRPSRVRPSR